MNAARRIMGAAACQGAATLQEGFAQAWARWKTWQIRGRGFTFPLFAKPACAFNRPRVFVVITHHMHHDPRHFRSKADKLRACVEGVLRNLSHCDLRILVNTVPERHCRAELPAEIEAITEWRVETIQDPMFLGFRAVDWILNEPADYDYYIYLEDDIVLADAMFLDKVAAFQAAAPEPNWLLMPNRFEYDQQTKKYIDIGPQWSDFSKFSIGEYVFAENVNPHSGAFVLNQAQRASAKAAKLHLRDRDSYTGPRESAATGWLLAHFRIFNPAPPNLHYHEVWHWDEIYSRFPIK